MSLLRIEDASKQFIVTKGKARRTIHALNHVSLAIDAGETLGIVGESGSGKTTLGKGMITFQSFDQGKIFY
ncbi:ATP-binding cassette domain-containing protein [Enterococcus columbae]|uniref:ABC transporter domain-containing protein n=1 Tax=Enterococcus columbae DSM 7374 = ATCC 51263 TaxID=1121865 RepID=S0KK89_9ENTE|nr:ATP-binding cassette domain-containing protein [Enterococcus columbae]EOT39636.1 hypothetical protein OMW_01833 [Enterococcus columbae DSM 7374 = ATCC 51263]EOW84029.1 hypothetical protein I568_01476 [Enterococcus columbae DSM 7374 = ATCC 51263]OJG25751.1 hypothetical protein RR47_GL001257 [Enterococcus columbae DSM 7374 = ATCC 51263]